ncbi:carotenoid oxygenase family protein [Rhodopila globiformis]|uniref:Dioxygenase n=1 Tax=Rhodopila globiformis TaxID=1071 RepID=A0A2S6N630_RHOGL|nr:carotenoid oxygenase family protein [Rhodopila globiformis]PPQ30076.1 carotenoid oxygenase [Rhodopila globiformis]
MATAPDATSFSNFAPIGTEYDLPALRVTGELPKGLAGTLFRNGPNPQFPPLDPLRDHWFAGDGMVHAFTIADGTASYRNRWVRTDRWLAEHAAGRALVAGFGGPELAEHGIANTGVANTNVVWHAGRLLALEEGHLPFELDPATLTTRGVRDFGTLHDPFTAHPKTDPLTGDLIFFGCYAGGAFSPTMTCGVLGADGRVKRLERFEAPYCAMVHDFAVTERHIVFPVMPLTGSMARAMAGESPFAWEPDLGTHIGVMERAQGVASLRWFRAENCFVFHVMNAWDQDGRIMLDVMQYAAAPLFPRADGRETPPADTNATLMRWTLDPAAGTDAFTRAPLDDMCGEFPRLDERRTSLPNRYGLFVGGSRDGAGLDTIVWHDFTARRRSAFTVPSGDSASEAVFVPRSPSAPEGDGWLLSVAWRAQDQRSDLVILDTQAVADGPVATVHLPHRVPFGFHGNWVDAGR